MTTILLKLFTLQTVGQRILRTCIQRELLETKLKTLLTAFDPLAAAYFNDMVKRVQSMSGALDYLTEFGFLADSVPDETSLAAWLNQW